MCYLGLYRNSTILYQKKKEGGIALHIADGIIPPLISIGSLATTGGITALLSIKLKKEEIPKLALTTAVLFVSSLFHIPIGPSSIHPVLGGIAALILGPKVFISILVALFFQAVMFSHGGILSIGVNALSIGGGALIVSILSIPITKYLKNDVIKIIYYFLVGFFSIFLSSVFVSLFLLSAGTSFRESIKIIIVSHLILAVIEGILTVIVIQFLNKAKPELLFYNQGKDVVKT
jgi:cobalt/nickel transport system permease protein